MKWTRANLTQTQKKYLFDAAQICQFNPLRGIYFSLWSPGRSGTGRALLRRGLIAPHLPTREWPFHITAEGWEIVWDLYRNRSFEGLKEW